MLTVHLDLCMLVWAFCVHSTWHCALTVRLSTSDTKVTFAACFVHFDVVVSLVFSIFAMCFVFTDCPVLYSLLLYKVLIAVMCLYLHFVLWISVLVFGWCLSCFSVVVFCSFDSELI